MPSSLYITEDILRNITNSYKEDIKCDFKWVSLENIKEAVLLHAFQDYGIEDFRIPSELEPLFSELTLYAWGLNPLGLSLIGHPYPGYPKRLDQHPEIEPLTHQKWITPLSYDKPERASTGSDRRWREGNDFILSIGWENAVGKRDSATITIAALKPIHQFRIPGGYSARYDALTGEQATSPTLYTSNGEVVWSTKTKDSENFIQALCFGTELLKDKEKLNLLVALTYYDKSNLA
jgi:hypothetical protein